MILREALTLVVEPGLAVLPSRMTSPEAKAMLLTIGLQESKFLDREQIGGPAHGFYQFERGGGIVGVLNHPNTKYYIDQVLERLDISSVKAYDAVVYNDVLATAFARLLLWSDPQPLPSLDSDVEVSWGYYLRNWRPGKPHPETWPGYRRRAVQLIKEVS